MYTDRNNLIITPGSSKGLRLTALCKNRLGLQRGIDHDAKIM